MTSNSPYGALLDVEKNVAKADRLRVDRLGKSNRKLQSILRGNWPELKQQFVISEMIARRMFYYHDTQKELKSVLNISLAGAASDILEQAVGMYLSAYLSQFGGFEIKMNCFFDGKIRPDIAVLYNGSRLAVVEVKTNLGWQRDYFSAGKWKKRRDQCASAKFENSFIFILTKVNWETEYQRIKSTMKNENIFVLLKKHPNDENISFYKKYSTRLKKSEIIRCIETMFEQIKALALGTQI